jgi:hypothetical protein
MANGGWYGTPEEWQRLENPLLSIDPVLEQFASEHSLHFSRNGKDSPERSLRWGGDPGALIQIFLQDEAGPTWDLWFCYAEDRGESRFWCKDFAIQNKLIEEFQEQLPDILQQSFNAVERWRASPERLEFATKLAAMPPM